MRIRAMDGAAVSAYRPNRSLIKGGVFATLLISFAAGRPLIAQVLVDSSNSAQGASSSTPDPLHYQNAGSVIDRAVYIGYDSVNGTGYLDNTGSILANGTNTGALQFNITEDWGVGVGIFPGGQGFLINSGSGTVESNTAVRVGDAFFGTGAYGEFHHQSSGGVTGTGYTYLTVGNFGGTGKFFHTGSGAVNFGGQIWIGFGAGNTGTVPSNGQYTLANSTASVTAGQYLYVGADGGQGSFTQSGGSVTVGVAGNEFTDFPELYLGHNGGSGTYDLEDGTLTINGWSNLGRDGGQALFNNSATFVTTQELRLGVDYSGNGTAVLNNLDGGVIQAGTNDTIRAIAIGTGFDDGIHNSSVGTLNQHGVGSSVIADGWLIVGDTGKGTLDETNGTITVKDNLMVGNVANSTGIFNQSSGVNTVEGIYPTFTGNLVVGNAGNGTFTQTGGENHLTSATVTTVAASVSVQNVGNLDQAADGNFVVGRLSTGTGIVEQSGGANTIAANLGVGLEGTGTYTLKDTGALTVGSGTGGGDLLIAAAAGSSGAFNLQGGTLNVTGGNGIIAAGLGTAAFNFTGGTLRAKLINSNMFGGNLGNLSQSGTSSVLDVTTNSTTINAGYNLSEGKAVVAGGQTLSVIADLSVSGGGAVNGAGTVAVDGNADLSNNGSYGWQLTAPSTTNAGTDFGVITVGGDLMLGGSSSLVLDFSLLGANGPNGSNPFWDTNKSWKIVDTTSNTSGATFHSIVNATFASGSFSTSVGIGGDLGDIFLNFVVGPALPGDFDGDGDVDGADFVAWQTNFPTTSGATPDMGDADGDGDVDGADFSEWQDAFPGSSPGTTPVPEPKGLIMAALGGIAAMYNSKRRWSRGRPGARCAGNR